tara:strand:+ start:797 stop:937 length:141 start_codon:yes stop_codon:yes gene_type:complete
MILNKGVQKLPVVRKRIKEKCRLYEKEMVSLYYRNQGTEGRGERTL